MSGGNLQQMFLAPERCIVDVEIKGKKHHRKHLSFNWSNQKRDVRGDKRLF